MAKNTVTVERWESQYRAGSRGRPWRETWGLEVTVQRDDVAYVFNAREPRASDPDPLSGGHHITLGGIEYTSVDDGPPDLRAIATSACIAYLASH